MSTVYIGSARIDENGRTHGGTAGDQTGREVSRQKWYRHAKGWRVIRPLDRDKALKIAQAMESACDNSNIGYDQWQRNSLYVQARKHHFDISKVASPCETDCSALVRVCCAFGGIDGLSSDFRTANMAAMLLATGYFSELTGDKYTGKSAYLGRGDILVTRTSGHTVVVLNDGCHYEANAVSQNRTLGDRTLRNGCEGEDVVQLQSALIALGYDCGPWGADGDFGDGTEMALTAFQRHAGISDDGIYGPKTHAHLFAAMDSLEADPPENPQSVTICGGQCWVRTGPSVKHAPIRVARNGETLPYAGEVSDAGWLKVALDSQTGWVSGKYGRLI